MKRRLLGKTRIEVSEIAFGGVEIGIPYGIGVKNKKDMPSEKEAIHLLHAAVGAGINFFDTARLYGKSEMIMGKAFSDRRNKIVLSTKCTRLRNVKGKLPALRPLMKMIDNSLKESLKALRTDHVDIFMLHSADMEILCNGEIARKFSDLRRSGVARAIGASTYTPEETEKAMSTGIWDVVQLPYNLMDQRHGSFFSMAAKKGIGIVVRSVLLKGLLSDRGKNLHPALKNVEDHITSYSGLIKNTGNDLPGFATKFALSFKEVSSVLVGIDRMEYLKQSLKAADGRYLNKRHKLLAGKLSYPDPGFLNLPHWEKEGWLK